MIRYIPIYVRILVELLDKLITISAAYVLSQVFSIQFATEIEPNVYNIMVYSHGIDSSA